MFHATCYDFIHFPFSALSCVMKRQTRSSRINRFVKRIRSQSFQPSSNTIISSPQQDSLTLRSVEENSIDHESSNTETLFSAKPVTSMSFNDLTQSDEDSDDDSHFSYACDSEQTNQVTPSSEAYAKEMLRTWAIKYNITSTSLTALLHGLQPLVPHIPKCSVTLLKTPEAASFCPVRSGFYIHLGIRQFLLKRLNSGIRTFKNEGSRYGSLKMKAVRSEALLISLKVNVDGIPLFKSSNVVLWPILCIVNEAADQTPFVCGFFVGPCKPQNNIEFLQSFCNDFKALQNSDIVVNGRQISLEIFCLVCDAPARSFSKGVKSFGGYYGCDYCRQKGSYHFEGHKVIFPSFDAELRSDEAFVEHQEIGHQISSSPLEDIMPMVSAVPPEYMHLICLGVMRRLLLLWTSPSSDFRLTCRQRKQLSDSMVSLGQNLPSEFHRKMRPLQELERYKAVEFRTFLLYVGPVCLKQVLPDNMYQHFLLLHVALYIYLGDIPYFYQAEMCLLKFVEDMGHIYGEGQYVYNVHCLSHFARFYAILGSPEVWSAFPFENYLQTLKRRVRSKKNVAAQLISRITELESLPPSVSLQVASSKTIRKCADSFYLTDEGVIIATEVHDNLCTGIKLEFVKHLYSLPYPSASFGIGIYKRSSKIVLRITCKLQPAQQLNRSDPSQK
jgi:hypothetical protein